MFRGMDRIGKNMQRVQANQGNPFPPPVYARYAKFLPATQHFCLLFPFLIKNHCITADLCAFCAKSAVGPLQWAFLTCTTIPPTIQSPPGHFRFRYCRLLATLESPLARCRAPIVSTKALLAGGATLPLGARGVLWPVLFGGKGRVPIPASISKAFWAEL